MARAALSRTRFPGLCPFVPTPVSRVFICALFSSLHSSQVPLACRPRCSIHSPTESPAVTARAVQRRRIERSCAAFLLVRSAIPVRRPRLTVAVSISGLCPWTVAANGSDSLFLCRRRNATCCLQSAQDWRTGRPRPLWAPLQLTPRRCRSRPMWPPQWRQCWQVPGSGSEPRVGWFRRRNHELV
jgi:hypothetical protein